MGKLKDINIDVTEAKVSVLADAYHKTRTMYEFIDHLEPIMTITRAELELAWNVMDYWEDHYVPFDSSSS